MAKEIKSISELVYDLNNTEIIRANNLVWDMILGGGFETGDTIQLVGEQGTGKTTLALQIALAFCQQNQKVLYLDTEASVNKGLINCTGLKQHINNNFLYMRESSFKGAETKLDYAINNEDISLIVVDSIANLTNDGYYTEGKKQISIINNNTNYESRPIGLFMKKYSNLCAKKNIVFLIINQYRNKISTTGVTKGTIEKRFGPKIVDYSSNVIIKINKYVKSENFKSTNDNTGVACELEIVKSNKLKPKTKLPYFFEYGQGINQIYNWVHFLIEKGLVVLNGTYYEFSQFNIKENGLSNFILKLKACQTILFSTYMKEFYIFYSNLIK